MASYVGCKVKFTGTLASSNQGPSNITEVYNTSDFTVDTSSDFVTVKQEGYYHIHGVWGPSDESSGINHNCRIRRRPDGGSFGEIFAQDDSTANTPQGDTHFTFDVPLVWLNTDDDIDFTFYTQLTKTFATDHGESWAVIELATALDKGRWGGMPI